MTYEKSATVKAEDGTVTECFTVQSESGRGTYNVQIQADGSQVYCSCKSFEFSAWPKTCKHIRQIQSDD